MIRIMPFETDFYNEIKDTDRKFVIYGCGRLLKRIYPFLKDIEISYICDISAKEGQTYNGISVITPLKLSECSEKFVILICIQSESIREQVKKDLGDLDLDALIFDLYECSSFNVFRGISENTTDKELKKVRIICVDHDWILYKFALKLQENLTDMKIQCDIGDGPDNTADINHYISVYEPIRPHNDTLMVTHFDSKEKIERLRFQLKFAKMAVCMSKDTMNMLVTNGIPREKLCYINPAHDGVVRQKKTTIGITHRCYDHVDHRKKQSFLIDLCEQIDTSLFEFKIMGQGWNDVVDKIRASGIDVTYYPSFDYDIYMNELMPSLDYYLYWGFDEGSMGYLDALAAGVKTIVTPQGFHLDVAGGITYACRTEEDFVNAFNSISDERIKLMNTVKKWTWKAYTEKHVVVWRYILGNREHLYEHQHEFEDGFYSVMPFKIGV